MPKTVRTMSADLGKGWSKVRSSSQALSFQSVIAIESGSVDFDTPFNPETAFMIEYEGERWTLGETVYNRGGLAINIESRQRINTDFYKVLFVGAMTAVLKNSCEVHPILSLPPGSYYDKNKQKAQLAGNYQVTVFQNGTPKTLEFVVPLEHIRVVPEGFGTICSFVLDEDGRMIDDTLFKNVVGIVDVGTLTYDLIMMDKLQLVRRSTDSFNGALNIVHKRIKEYASKMGVDIPDYKLDQCLKNRYFLKDGKPESLIIVIETAAKELAQAIEARILSLWNDGNDVEYILLTGGGASLAYDYIIEKFGQRVYIVEDMPHFANCEGAWRYLQLKIAAQGA